MADGENLVSLTVNSRKTGRTNYNYCVICQKHTEDKTRVGKVSSVKKLLAALEARKDGVYERLVKDPADSLLEKRIIWHSRCYETVTSKTNLQFRNRQDSEIEDGPVIKRLRVSRSTIKPMDWSKCMFCQNITYKKNKALIYVSTFEACQTIRRFAEAREDEFLTHHLEGINNDLIAAKGKYHKLCHAKYVSTSKSSEEVEDSSSQGTSPHSSAFSDLVSYMLPGINAGKAYDMTTLLEKYKTFLCSKGVDGTSYTRQKLKAKLQKYFLDKIVFHQPDDRTEAELVYSKSISLKDLINAAVKPGRYNGTQSAEKNQHSYETDKVIQDAANIIKAEIKECKGISIQPLRVDDLNLETSKAIIPKSLYNLLRLIMSPANHNDDNTGHEITGERRVIMLAQDIIHCASRARIKLPKHTSLAVTVRHLTGSKQLITMLNRMGHCSSYEEVEVIDTSLAKEALAMIDDSGSIIPSNIHHGSFVQMAADNNDLNEETLDGKHTTHATNMVVYQQKQFGPLPQRQVFGDHSQKERSLDHTHSTIIQEFSSFGKRPMTKEFLGNIDMKWFQLLDEEYQFSCSMDLAWMLLRLCPEKFCDVDLQPTSSNDQIVPGWSGVNVMVNPRGAPPTNIGYCPMIQASSVEFSTIFTIMKQAQAMATSLGQATTVITLDLAMYMKAKQVQWQLPEEFSDTVIRLGGFHIALNYLSLLGKKYTNSGIQDMLVESCVYGEGTASALLRGDSYNRGVRAHKLLLEALFRLMWKEFTQWLKENAKIDQQTMQSKEQLLVQNSKDCLLALENEHGLVEQRMKKMISENKELMEIFEVFKEESRQNSHLFAFWNDYTDMVIILLQFIKGERTGSWDLHLSATTAMLPHFYAMDRQNYSRWIPVYLADMKRLEATHPIVHSEFRKGNHSVSRTGQPFTQVSTDMALEQSINRDTKTKGGIVGISQKPRALERWFLTCHERAAVTSALKTMCSIEDTSCCTIADASPARMSRDERDIKEILKCFTSGLLANPFAVSSCEKDDHPSPLINLATGVVLPEDAATRLLNASTLGKEQVQKFVEKRLNTNEINFWEPLRKLSINTFRMTEKKVALKRANEQTVSIAGDRLLFGRLLVAARNRDIDLKELLSHELSAVPFSLAHCDGNMRKTNKSVLLGILEDYAADIPSSLPTEHDSSSSTAYIIDAMAMIHMVKTAGATTFGDLAAKYYSYLVSKFGRNECHRVDVVFDRYASVSIKSAERQRRGDLKALEISIHSLSTPVPKQWDKYISNPRNKTNLSAFLSEAWCTMAKNELKPMQQLVIGGGFTSRNKVVSVTQHETSVLLPILSDHEEADTRILLHAQHAALHHKRIIVQSPDTDVAVLCITHYVSVNCKELWFHTGVKDKVRFVPMHTISAKLGPELCQALPAFHALTGCDSTSALYRMGKKKAWNILVDDKVHQNDLAKLGEDINLQHATAAGCERFICSLYGSMKPNSSTADEVRYFNFCQKGQKTELLPPTSDSLTHHMKRANYQTFIWRKSLDALMNIPDPYDHGWELKDGQLNIVWTTKSIAPTEILELTICRCKSSSCASRCSCKSNKLKCTEACLCMATESCRNCYNDSQYLSDSDSE